jgi:hypothetical protein
LDQKASRGDRIGGSTYHFDLWRGHPLEDAVLGELERFRERMSALRERVDHHNQGQLEKTGRYRVDAYYGQSVMEDDDAELDENESGQHES